MPYVQHQCKCGCGTDIPDGNTYVKYHHLKEAAKLKRPRKSKKRKYKKRNSKYWGHKKENQKITSYVFPELQKEILGLQNFVNTRLVQYSDRLDKQKEQIDVLWKADILHQEKIKILEQRSEWQNSTITDMRRSVERLSELLTKERNVTMRFAGIE